MTESQGWISVGKSFTPVFFSKGKSGIWMAAPQTTAERTRGKKKNKDTQTLIMAFWLHCRI